MLSKLRNTLVRSCQMQRMIFTVWWRSTKGCWDPTQQIESPIITLDDQGWSTSLRSMIHSQSSEVTLHLMRRIDYYWNIKLDNRKTMHFSICFSHYLYYWWIMCLSWAILHLLSLLWALGGWTLRIHQRASLPSSFGWVWLIGSTSNTLMQREETVRLPLVSGSVTKCHSFYQVALLDSRFRQLLPPLTSFVLWMIKGPAVTIPYGFPTYIISLINNPFIKTISNYTISTCHQFLASILTDTSDEIKIFLVNSLLSEEYQWEECSWFCVIFLYN